MSGVLVFSRQIDHWRQQVLLSDPFSPLASSLDFLLSRSKPLMLGVDNICPTLPLTRLVLTTKSLLLVVSCSEPMSNQKDKEGGARSTRFKGRWDTHGLHVSGLPYMTLLRAS